MDYVPQINEAKPLKSIPLATGKHTAVLLADIKSSGSVKYEFILVVLNDETDEPCLFVTSEVNTFAKTIGGSSHFLGLFPGDGHLNLGESNDWGDISMFEKEAVRVATDHLGG